jgi:endoglucanase
MNLSSLTRRFSIGSLGVFLITPCSAKVLLDPVGYLPHETKVAVTVGEKGRAFRVIDEATGRLQYEGRLGPEWKDPATGLRVRQADFTPLTREGAYHLELEGGAASRSFHIKEDVFAEAAQLAMRSFYGQRCGVAVDLGPRFPDCSHGACHTEDGRFHPSSGRSGRRDAARGWHDAGDYGKYIVNSGITTGTLLLAWELYGDRWAALRLHLPEAGGKLPEFLAEVRWNLDWMLSMQDEDGGVWHKLTSETFCPFIPPEKDRDPRFLIGTGTSPFKNSAATGDFAAVMAQASRVFRPFDPAFAKRCLRAAEAAWPWLEAHPDVLFSNPPGVRTGGYGDKDCSDERLWAAVELYRATGKAPYHQAALRLLRARREPWFPSDNPPSWGQVAPLACVSYLLAAPDTVDAPTAKTLRSDLLRSAKDITQRTLQSPWRHSLIPANYIWGSNSVALNYSLLLLLADHLEANPSFRDAALDNLHYVLGRNAFDVCWVTRLRENSFRHPHHRPSASNRDDQPWPGLLSGGPNAGRQDPILQRLSPNTPPALCWVDERGSFAGNENAINWNAPLVFVLSAALPEPPPSRARRTPSQRPERLEPARPFSPR